MHGLGQCYGVSHPFHAFYYFVLSPFYYCELPYLPHNWVCKGNPSPFILTFWYHTFVAAPFVAPNEVVSNIAELKKAHTELSKDLSKK